MNQYELFIAQPSIIGYYSLSITLSNPWSYLRFTNYVEIMCPCFEVEAFKNIHRTFRENKSCWGIDFVWNHLLDNPTNKIAIVDCISAIHTRPIFRGDNYKNNPVPKGHSPFKDMQEVCNKYGIEFADKLVYDSIRQDDCDYANHKQSIYPNNKKIVEICKTIREGSIKML